jgi:polyribonucleotide nucleotidyltransferase
MSNTPKISSIEIGGRSLTIETGKLAGQADGSVTVHYGDTIVLVTACVGSARQEERDFLPLTVDFEERLYAAGKIPGSFFRREGRPGQDATLAMRLTDRSIRPLFPKGFRREVQVIATVLSADQENDPDILLILGASAALGLSSIPFAGPVSAVRMGYIDGEYIINPTFSQLEQSLLDLVVSGTSDAVSMVEAGAKEVSEEIVLKAIKIAQETNVKIIEAQESFVRSYGKAKLEFKPPSPNEELEQKTAETAREAFPEGPAGIDRGERDNRLSQVKEKLLEHLSETCSAMQIGAAVDAWLKKEVRAVVLEKGTRISGRTLDEIRSITCEVGLLPRTHGSGLFSRGETQALTIATLGSLRQEQTIDSIGPEESKRYMHHYYFPPFSTGEVKRLVT